jgi:hypothetical protein
MEGLDQALLTRLPLVEASGLLLGHVLSEAYLEEFYAQHRGRGYEKELRFSTLVSLIWDALVQHGGSGRQSFEQARREERLPVSNEAAYGKLARLPVRLSVAFLATTTDRLREVLPPSRVSPVPPSLAAFQVIVFDGKKLKRLAKRLKPVRAVSGKLLGGKLLVAWSLEDGLALAMSASPDGEANDAPLVAPLLPQVRQRVSGRRLWVADRQFSDTKIPRLLEQDGDAFLIRHNRNLSFEADPDRPAQSSTDAQGRTVREEWGWLGQAPRRRTAAEQRLYVRRITLSRRGAEDVLLLTNLLDSAAVPAADLLALYAERWGIERVFQQVTEVFQLQQLIGSTPQAAVFQGAFCLLLYNVLQTLRGYVAQSQHRAAETISSELLFRDVTRQWISWTTLGDPAYLIARCSGVRSPADLRQRLTCVLGSVWSEGWLKSPRKKRWNPPQHTPVPGGHSSAWKLLQAAACPSPATKRRC